MAGATWQRISVAALALLILAGCGAQGAARPAATPHRQARAASPPAAAAQPPTPAPADPPAASSPPVLAASQHPLNGCTPSVFGFCVATYPQFYCCSAAFVGWSHIYVGESVDVRGSVQLYTDGKPDAKDAYILSPSGVRSVLPVDAAGGFSRRIRFTEPGKYLMGLDPSGPGSPWSSGNMQAVPFYVAYRAVPAAAETLAATFRGSHMHWSGIRVLAAPLGRHVTFRVRFTDASGHPAAHVALRLNGGSVTTDAQGYAEIPFAGGEAYALDEIYTGLFVQTYSRVAIRGGRLLGLPVYAPSLAPPAVRVITAGGQPMVDVRDFLLWGVADIIQSPSQGVPAVAFDSATGILRLNSLGDASLDTRAGEFTWTSPLAGSYRIPLRPVVQAGQVYLTLADLSRVLDTFAWARPQPDGSLLFSTFEVP